MRYYMEESQLVPEKATLDQPAPRQELDSRHMYKLSWATKSSTDQENQAQFKFPTHRLVKFNKG